ncbi:MAG: transporter [Chloroflexi bacterium]|nr:transporter [Chloroflexota bacterium]
MARSTLVSTDIPARMDRLPWSRWHWTVVFALGITWILDGLEVTIINAVSGVLQKPDTLHLSTVGVSAAASSYIAGAVVGSLIFGYLTDQLGRKKLFMVTLSVYTTFTVCTAFSWNEFSYVGFRFLTGLGIGGEYAAINSAIDELIPARRRGWTDLSINSSYWMGAILASGLSLVLLDPKFVPESIGWRLCFATGAVLALSVILVRRHVPESPRWLLTHGRVDEAERIVRQIESTVQRDIGKPLAELEGSKMTVDTSHRVSFRDVVNTMVRTYPRRSIVALSLMVTQAFLYNAIFFTEALVLTTFFGVSSGNVGLYIFPFALGNLLGPWILGHLFDTIGRRRMIAGTYIISGLLLVGTGILFVNGMLNATTITVAWSVIFFFASAGASSAYLTASETFPMELRAQAIAFVYSVGTLAGGAAAPLIFGALIATHRPINVFYGYMVGAALMIAGGLVEWIWGIDAERKSLEEVAAPLSQSEGPMPRVSTATG